MALHLAQMTGDSQRPYQALLDASAMPVRDAKRRGQGWLAGRADIGWSNSLGWYEGFSLLTAVEPSGVITQVFVSGPPPPLSRAIGGDLLRYKGTAEPEAAKRRPGGLRRALYNREGL